MKAALFLMLVGVMCAVGLQVLCNLYLDIADEPTTDAIALMGYRLMLYFLAVLTAGSIYLGIHTATKEGSHGQ